MIYFPLSCHGVKVEKVKKKRWRGGKVDPTPRRIKSRNFSFNLILVTNLSLKFEKSN